MEAEAIRTRWTSARIVVSVLSHSGQLLRAVCARRDKGSDAGTLSDEAVPPGDRVLLGQSS